MRGIPILALWPPLRLPALSRYLLCAFSRRAARSLKRSGIALFSFTAPFSISEEDTAVPMPGFDINGKPVLVVDDNPSHRRILKEILGEHGQSLLFFFARFPCGVHLFHLFLKNGQPQFFCRLRQCVGIDLVAHPGKFLLKSINLRAV